MDLERVPSIITGTEFNKEGLAVTKDGLLVPAYVASQLGFSDLGKAQLQEFYNRLKDEADVLTLCPFTSCGEYLDFSRLDNLKSNEDVIAFWNEFNRIVGQVNYKQLMPKSKLMIAILDGGHALDDGVSAEIGYYAAAYNGNKPIVGIRSDIRLAENPAAPINPAVRYFIDEGPYNGYFFFGKNSYNDAIRSIKDLTNKIKESSY
jgi:hypothetical protein